MALLAKWILENKPNDSVVIVTDREELDKQIEGVFTDAGYPPARAHPYVRFIALMTQFMPNWRYYRNELNRLPVRHEYWAY
jgi:type I restriction enzyme R subunit